MGRRRGAWWVVVVACAALAGAACGDSEEGADEDAGDPGGADVMPDADGFVVADVHAGEAVGEADSGDTHAEVADSADIAADLPTDGPEDGAADAGDALEDAAPETEGDAVDDAPADAAPETLADAGKDGDTGPEADADTETAAPLPDPWEWGPYEVGTASYSFFDWDRMRSVPVTVWYPATPLGQPKATYLVVIQGDAYTGPNPDMSNAPYPVVLFSHGFRGAAVQSISFTEHLASHGYVVVAPDHSGNTLTDFFSDDEKVAQVALQRPGDVIFAFDKAIELSGTPGEYLTGMIDPTRVAMTGHSFGGYTTLMIAGGEVNVADAQAACAAGTPADIFCDYVGYWPSGETVRVDPGIPGLKAAVALAPGGSAAFGPGGLAGVKVPVAVFGGTLDPTTPVDIEIDPIYAGLPAPKAEGIVESASHMSYTNVCDIPLSDQLIKDYCGVEGMLGPDETFAVVNGVAVAWLGLYLHEDARYAELLDPAYLAERCPSLDWTRDEP